MGTQLREIDLFHGLSNEQVEPLLGMFERRVFAAGELILGPGSDTGRLYLVIEGTVRLLERSPEGREVTIDLLGQGRLFGLGGLLGLRHPGHLVQAAGVSVIGSAQSDHLLAAVARRPRLMRNLLAQLSARLARHEQRLGLAASADARTRLAATLYRLASAVGEQLPDGTRRLPPALTHSALAQQIGSRRETVCRLLAGFDAEGLIRREAGGVLVIDLPTLAEAFELADGV
jgi:CRP/FNR family transcriptional regulator